MTPAWCAFGLVTLTSTFFAGWMLGSLVANYREARARRERLDAPFLVMTAAMRRMSGGDR